jgi:glycosyltransferase involved in cell wall biosynthesis
METHSLNCESYSVNNIRMNAIAICIVAYNQESYIGEAIESVLMQDVSIPFTVFIGEDCSTDSTLKICLDFKNRFPEKILLLHNKKNIGLVRNTNNVLKYIIESGYRYTAMLDGDDYWNDKLKLQKEIDYLEKNPDYGLVHTNVALLMNNQIVEVKAKIPHGDVFNQIDKFSIANCTVLFRTGLLKRVELDDFVKNQFMSCDYVMYVIFAKYTKFGFIDDFTAVWRRGHTSVSNTNDINKDIAYIENDLRMWKYLDSLFPERFGYNEILAARYSEHRKFSIAFRYGNFNLAHNILKNGNLERRSLMYEIKKIAASNKLLFNLWAILKNKKLDS